MAFKPKAKEMTIRGKTSFAKIIGDPVYNKFSNANEWTVDIILDKNTVKELEKAGLASKIKKKESYLEGQPYISFKQPEFRTDRKTGTLVKNDPIKIVDITEKPWDGRLIGNGSVVDVKFAISGEAPRIGAYVRAIRVLDLVTFEKRDFAPISEDDEFFAKVAEAGQKTEMENDVEDDLDDEIPF